MARTATRTLDALKALIAERHARFNDTLYQLEPDVKEAPGGLRDLFGAQTIAMLTDPALLGAGRVGRARARGRRGVPAARPLDPAPRGQAPSQRPRPRAAGARGRVPRLRRRDAAAAVERFMGDYFRHARAIDRSLRWALRARAGAGRPQSGARRRRHPVRRRARGGRASGNLAGAVPGGHRRRLRGVRRGAAVHRSRTPAASRRRSSSRRASHRDALLHFLKPQPGPLRAAVGDARLGAARPDDPGVQGDQLPRRPRLLPQVHGRRAHAADDPQPRAADSSAAPERERFRAAARRARTRRSCWSCRCCYHDVGKWTRRGPRGRERADGARSCSIASTSTTTARATVRVPGRRAPEDVARRLPARHRRSGDRPAVRRARRRRGAAEDALPA